MRSNGITLVITTVGAPRRSRLRTALDSVFAQTLQPDQIVISQDIERYGAAWNRHLGTESVRTPYVAYLDDDDTLKPDHLQSLLTCLKEHNADLVYPWFDVQGGTDPFPMFFGVPWDNEDPHQIPVTVLARTEAIRAAGGWYDDTDPDDPTKDPAGNRAGEDWRLTQRMVANDAKIVHLPRRTWTWFHWGQNTSGQPSRVLWDQVG